MTHFQTGMSRKSQRLDMHLKYTWLPLLAASALVFSSVASARDIWRGDSWDQGKTFWKSLIEAPWYGGAAAGLNTPAAETYENGTGGFFYIGREISHRVFAEAGYSTLGTFELSTDATTEVDVTGFYAALTGESIPVEKYNLIFVGRIAAYNYTSEGVLAGIDQGEIADGTAAMFSFGIEWRALPSFSLTADMTTVNGVVGSGWTNGAAFGVKARF